MKRFVDEQRFEMLRPQRLQEIIQNNEWIFVPIGSMEWHSYHLGMGVDTIHAYELAKRLSQKLGGSVFPPIYIGTENRRSPESLRKLGFTGDEEIYGMDFPANTLPSQYWPENLFEQIINTQIMLLIQMGFQHIALINGHGSSIQKEILNRLAKDWGNQKHGVQVLSLFGMTAECSYGLGHAGLVETAVMMAICPEMVDLNALPDRSTPLHYAKYGIADSGTNGKDHIVTFDPRDATKAIGEEILRQEVAVLSLILEKETKK